LLRDMMIIVQYRYGPEIPNDDAGRGDLDIILKLHAGHPTNGGDRVKHCIDILAPWMSQEERDITVSDLTGIDGRRIRPCRNELREQVRLSAANMERLGITHIPPFDLTDQQLADYRRAKRNAKRRARRSKQPRDDFLRFSISRLEPWKTLGIGRPLITAEDSIVRQVWSLHT
jgi:hypothetical protein